MLLDDSRFFLPVVAPESILLKLLKLQNGRRVFLLQGCRNGPNGRWRSMTRKIRVGRKSWDDILRSLEGAFDEHKGLSRHVSVFTFQVAQEVVHSMF